MWTSPLPCLRSSTRLRENSRSAVRRSSDAGPAGARLSLSGTTRKATKVGVVAAEMRGGASLIGASVPIFGRRDADLRGVMLLEFAEGLHDSLGRCAAYGL